jgi:hypothetical protein
VEGGKPCHLPLWGWLGVNLDVLVEVEVGMRRWVVGCTGGAGEKKSWSDGARKHTASLMWRDKEFMQALQLHTCIN